MDLVADLALLATTTTLAHVALGLRGIGLLVVVLAVLTDESENGRRWLRCLLGRWKLVHASDRRLLVPAQQGQEGGDDRASDDDDREHDGGQVDAKNAASRVDCEDVDEEDAVENARDEERSVEPERISFGTLSTITSSSSTAPNTSMITKIARLVVRDIASTAPLPSRSSAAGSDSTATTVESTTDEPLPPPVRRRPRVQMNSHKPIPFENELFVGHVLFLVRTNPEDPHWRHLFVGKRRMFWIQVQGRFKRRPRGVVYLGGELPAPIALGLFTKSLALVIMGIIQKLVGRVNYSFGESRREGDLPAVAFPLYQSVDQFVVTPAGMTPPPLGREDFGESEDARRHRRQTPLGHEQFEVGPTYSFHFHTMYVDLTKWKTANLPGLSDMNLSTFFDSLPLRLAAYDIDAEPSARHLQAQKAYLFCFEVQYRDQEDAAVPQLWRADSEVSVGSSADSNGTGHSGATESVIISPNPSPNTTVTAADMEDLRQDELSRALQENAHRVQALSFQYLYWLEEVEPASTVRRVQYVLRVQDCVEHPVPSRLVVVSAYKLRLLLGGKYRRLPRLYTLQSLRFHARSRIGSYSTICAEAIEVASSLQRLLAQCREDNMESAHPLMVSFQSELHEWLVGRSHLHLASDVTPSSIGVNLSKRDREDMRVAFEGVVYRFYTESVARQEVLVMTSINLQFYRSHSSSPDKLISCDRVIGVQAIPVPHGIEDYVSGPTTTSERIFGFAFQISTFGEEIVVCVTTEQARNTWIRVILQQCCPHINFDRSLEQPLAVCYTPSKPMQPANRIVLNSRSLFPRPDVLASQDPVEIIATALTSAMNLQEQGVNACVTAILDFLNLTSSLRGIDLEALNNRSHEERLAFYLNLYHTILAHAMIAQGYPRTKAQWGSFYTRMCYAVGRDLGGHPVTLSLAEIEQVILRARLPRADLTHVRLDEVYRHQASRLAPFGLSHPDFRVSLALASNNNDAHCEIFIYSPQRVHEQLNDAVQRLLAKTVRLHRERMTIYLPRVCEWYRQDFGGGGSPLYCVRKLLGFLDDSMRQQTLEILESPVLIHIKYDPFNYNPKLKLSSIPALSTG